MRSRLKTNRQWVFDVTFVLVLITALAVIAAATAHAHTGRGKHHKHHPHPQAFTGSLHKKHPRIEPVTIQGGKGGGGDPGDDYPAKWRNAPMDSMLDQWREYNRECTSFVAWALYSRNGFNMPFFDNANNWGAGRARDVATRSTRTPAVGSVAWSNAGSYGHVAYVVAVGGGNVTIEEYNEHWRRHLRQAHGSGRRVHRLHPLQGHSA